MEVIGIVFNLVIFSGCKPLFFTYIKCEAANDSHH